MENLKSDLWTLKAKDFFKGLILGVGTPVLILLQQLIPSWTPWLDEKLGHSGALIAQAALSAFVAYILKNLATDQVKEAQKTIVVARQEAIEENQKELNK